MNLPFVRGGGGAWSYAPGRAAGGGDTPPAPLPGSARGRRFTPLSARSGGGGSPVPSWPAASSARRQVREGRGGKKNPEGRRTPARTGASERPYRPLCVSRPPFPPRPPPLRRVQEKTAARLKASRPRGRRGAKVGNGGGCGGCPEPPALVGTDGHLR